MYLPLYTPATKVDEENIHLTEGLSLFKLFCSRTVILDEIMRQQSDDQQLFRSILNSLPVGTFSQKKWQTLQDRDRNESNFTPDQRDKLRKSAIMVCADNKDLKDHSNARIRGLGKPIA